MAVGLASAAMLARVKKSKQASREGMAAAAVTPCPEASMGDGKVVFFQDISLGLCSLGGDDEVMRNHGIFVEH